MSHKSTFRIALALFIALVMLVGVQAAPAHAANITVDVFDSTYDDNDACGAVTVGTLDPGVSLREAICAANNTGGADTISLSGHVILDTVDNTNDGDNGLPSVQSEITIDGNGYYIQRDAGGQAAFRIFHVTSGGSLTLDDVTVRYGLVDEASWAGAGVYLEGNTFLTVTNGSHINENLINQVPTRPVERSAGAGIFGGPFSTILIEEGSTVNYNNIWLADDSRLQCYGGGILAGSGSSLTIDDSEVVENYCGSEPGANGGTNDIHEAFGGGIAANGADVIIRNGSRVENNQTYSYNRDSYGGGIYSLDGSTIQVLDGSSVNDNYAEAYVGGTEPEPVYVYGGGISIEDGELTIDESQVLWNVAETSYGQGYGGGIFSESSLVNITDSQVSYNSFAEPVVPEVGRGSAYGRPARQYSTSYSFGGGIFNYNTELTVEGSEVSYNWAQDLGGGIFTADSYALFKNSQVVCNLAGFFLLDPEDLPDCDYPFIEEIRVPARVAPRPAAQLFEHYLAAGGGIFNAGGLQLERRVAQEEVGPPGLYVTDGSAVDRNVASNFQNAFGGGIANGILPLDGAYLVPSDSGWVAVDSSTVNDNLAYSDETTDTSYGGGLFNGPDGRMNVQQTTVDGNQSYYGNGGGAANYGDLRVGYSTFSNNWAGSDGPFWHGNGGGLFNAFSPFTEGNYLGMLNSTVSGNTADNAGGGIFNGGGGVGKVVDRANLQQPPPEPTDVELYNVTVSDNYAYGQGIDFRAVGQEFVLPVGGGLHDETEFNTISLWNTIVAHQGSGLDCWGSIASNGYNLDSDDTCNLTNTGDRPNSNARLDPLGDYGGPTFTHALKLNSPAIDNADPAGCYDPRDSGTLGDDQRGRHRPSDGDGDGDAVCDIGAYEVRLPGESEPDFTINVTAISITGSLIDWTVEVCNVGDAPAWSANVRIDVEDNQDPVSTDPVGTLSDHTFWVLLDLQPDECKTIGVVTEINESAGLTTDGAFAKLNDAHAKAERRQTADGPYCLDGSVADVADRDCISQTTLFPATLPETGGQPVGTRGGLLLAIVSAAVLSLLAGALLLFRKRLA